MNEQQYRSIHDYQSFVDDLTKTHYLPFGQRAGILKTLHGLFFCMIYQHLHDQLHCLVNRHQGHSDCLFQILFGSTTCIWDNLMELVNRGLIILSFDRTIAISVLCLYFPLDAAALNACQLYKPDDSKPEIRKLESSKISS